MENAKVLNGVLEYVGAGWGEPLDLTGGEEGGMWGLQCSHLEGWSSLTM